MTRKEKEEKRLFVVRKFIFGTSIAEVLRKEKNLPVDECYIDDDWRRNNYGLIPPFKDDKTVGFQQLIPKTTMS